jgi:hypothetical protein
MDHHDRRTCRIARSDVEDMDRCTGDLDHPALRGISALQHKDAGLGQQRQHRQRGHD